MKSGQVRERNGLNLVRLIPLAPNKMAWLCQRLSNQARRGLKPCFGMVSFWEECQVYHAYNYHTSYFWPCYPKATPPGMLPAQLLVVQACWSVWLPGFSWLTPINLSCSHPDGERTGLHGTTCPSQAHAFCMSLLHLAMGCGSYLGLERNPPPFVSQAGLIENTKDKVGRDIKRSSVQSPVQAGLPLSLGLYSSFQSKTFYLLV